MPMPSYPLCCYHRECGQPALYKIAARWSDGVTRELKTYALSCEACLADWFRLAQKKQTACRLAPGETLEQPGIYRIQSGQRDKQLERLAEMEQQLAAERPVS